MFVWKKKKKEKVGLGDNFNCFKAEYADKGNNSFLKIMQIESLQKDDMLLQCYKTSI